MLTHPMNFHAETIPRKARVISSSAFTLVEMLVSVALVVVLLLAATQIFTFASKTIGGGQAIGNAVRDAQAVQAVLARDFSAVVTDNSSPAFVIRNEITQAFRNKSDYLSDIDKNPATYDLDGDGVEETNYSTNGLILQYNFRNHRTDYLMFFARDRYIRQTGGQDPAIANDPLVAPQTGSEAVIFLHHLQLPDNSAVYYNSTMPGKGNVSINPNNYFANQWILGRSALLMVEPTGGVIRDTNGVPQKYISRGISTPSLTPLTPLSNDGSVANTLSSSRYDLVGSSIDKYKKSLSDYIKFSPTNASLWWQFDESGTYTAIPWRFHANPFDVKPINAAKLSQQVPIFLPSCSQFIVEFAGDFITQNWDPDGDGVSDTTADKSLANYGTFVSAGADGRIDTVPGTNQIRWYGMPRDTDGDGIIKGSLGDVVPVRDVAGTAQPFEKVFPTLAAIPLTTDYYGLTIVNPYEVAWGPGETNRPKMIRITIVIDRPEADGRLDDGQKFEYIFNVGQ